MEFVPLAYCRLKLIAALRGCRTHSLPLVPGDAQVVVPFGTTSSRGSSAARWPWTVVRVRLFFSVVEANELGGSTGQAVGADAVALVDLLDVQRLVDQVLDGLADVELREDLAGVPPSADE